MTLQRDELGSFVEQDFVIVRHAVPTEVLREWQTEIAEYMDDKNIRGGASSASSIRRSGNGFEFRQTTPKLTDVVYIRSAIGDLSGRLAGGSEQLIINWPRNVKKWVPPIMGHVDYYPASSAFRFVVGIVIYVFDVPHQAGGFCVWPGSHETTWQFFNSNPDEFGGRGSMPIDELQNRLVDIAPSSGPLEFVGEQGDMLVWHGLLVHNVSLNAAEVPRVALFARWGRRVCGEPRWVSESLWAGWSARVQRIAALRLERRRTTQ